MTNCEKCEQDEKIAREIIQKARKSILITKCYDEAISLILNSQEEINKAPAFYRENSQTSLALAYQEKQDYRRASEIYRKLDLKYQAGFCELLAGNETEAERLWYSCMASSPAVHWGRCLLDFIQMRKNPILPSYLEIRNFLEMDLGYFISANRITYAENLIKNENALISVNLESYKLIGRALLNFGFLNQAKRFLLKSIDIVDNDSETYYHLAQYYYAAGDYKSSLRELKTCLELNIHYLPANNLIRKIHLKTTSE